MADATLENPVTTNESDDSEIILDDQKLTGNYQTIGERFEEYNVILTNVLADAAFLAVMSTFNYNVTKINEGIALLENARDADAKNKKEYGEQYAAREKLEKELKVATEPYMTSLGVARIGLKRDAEAKKSLVLNGSRSRSLPIWIRDADVFYRNILSTDKFLSRMSDFGRTKEILEAEYKEVKDVQEAYAAHKKEMGEAQESTAVRDAKLADLDNWMSDFIGIIYIALKAKPDSLKKLGL
jgi:hypothetical protein